MNFKRKKKENNNKYLNIIKYEINATLILLDLKKIKIDIFVNFKKI
jgi:hypothetical protein